MHFGETLQYLLSLGHETLAIKLGLATTERLLQSLGSPQSSFPTVQIAGTNGKGSTAAMLDSICRAAGIATGLYTSPHLVSITERIRLSGREITQPEFARIATAVRNAAQQMQTADGALPTFFEQVTAIAFLLFSEAAVQLAILETGLGGRLDATTTAAAETIAITSVALDHQEYLGETLTEIAGEKAAIIHPGVAAAVVAPQPPEVLEVIERRARFCNVRLRYAGRRVDVLGASSDGRLRVTFTTDKDTYEDVCLALRGRHQATNAAVAIELAESLNERGFSISRTAITEGLVTAEHPGRLELQPGSPAVLFDGAHNVAGAQALRTYIDEFIKAPITLIFGVMQDKNVAEIAATLFPAAHHLILTRPTNPRAATVETLLHAAAQCGFDSSRITVEPDVRQAVTQAVVAHQQTIPAGVVCITGSLYLVGAAKSILGERS